LGDVLVDTKKLIAAVKQASVKNKIKKSDLVKILAEQKLSLDDISLENREHYLEVLKKFIGDKYKSILRVEDEGHDDIKVIPTHTVLKDLEFLLKKQGYHPTIDMNDGSIHVK
jgi:hypothetical protein